MVDASEVGPRFLFTEEHVALRQAVRQFSDRQVDQPAVRRIMDSQSGHDPSLWSRLADDLGIFGIGVPEGDGGSGGSLVDQAIVAEELGAALCPGPLLGTVYLAIPALVAAPPSDLRDDLLRRLYEGSATAAVALTDLPGQWDPARVGLHAERTGDSWTVSGSVTTVIDGGICDIGLVAAKCEDGLVLLAIDANDPRLTRTALTALDLTRRIAAWGLDRVPARLIADADIAAALMEHTARVGTVLLAAEQVGGAQHLLDLSVGYARDRVQFGRPIGSFQAVKHRLADMLVLVEHARTAAYDAAWEISSDPGGVDAEVAAALAGAACSNAFYRIAADSVQVHGGIGFTWEHQAHLYFKRATSDAAVLGSAEQHRETLARLILDPDSSTPAPPVATGLISVD